MPKIVNDHGDELPLDEFKRLGRKERENWLSTGQAVYRPKCAHDLVGDKISNAPPQRSTDGSHVDAPATVGLIAPSGSTATAEAYQRAARMAG